MMTSLKKFEHPNFHRMALRPSKFDLAFLAEIYLAPLS